MITKKKSLESDYHLAVSVSHNSSAAIMCDGEIIAAACEERFCRTKNFIGYPRKAIDYCLKKSGISPDQLKRVAYTTIKNPGILVKAKTNTEFSLQDYWDYYGDKYYQKKMRGEDTLNYFIWLRDNKQFNKYKEEFDFSYMTDSVLCDPEEDIRIFRMKSAQCLASHLNRSVDSLEFLDHHMCHAYYAYFGSPYRKEDCICVTLDGWGDGRNQTVWKISNDKFTLIAESDQNDLGRIYKMATLLLGMRPDEHEFKVMGLAPYAKESYVEKTRSLIDELCVVEEMRIVSKNRPADLFGYLCEVWKTHRFDNIAGAVQSYVEKIACDLFRDVAKQTGISRFVLGGGIALNVKMNKAIGEIPEIDELFVCGSSGDESLAIGGCYLLNAEHATNKPLMHLYLGYDIGDEINDFNIRNHEVKYNIKTNIKLSEVAHLLEKGDIVAVIRGAAEFGARALGNRSILAHPGIRDSVKRINEAIKNRDFWMPFALSILEEYHEDYLINPKKLMSPFMAISLDSKSNRRNEIVAGSHQYDGSVRPQFVSRDIAPQYHLLISEFMALTGTPALLNTSFNLHGEPIVNNMDDAIRTFEHSGLDHLLIHDSILLSKRV